MSALLKWLSGIDVNAVFLALAAAWGYIHNHRFRVSQQAPTSKPLEVPISPVTLLLVVALVGGTLAMPSCAGTPKERAVYAAEAACLPADLAAARTALAGAQANESKATVTVELALPALVCAALALGAPAPAPAAEAKPAPDAGAK